MKKFLAMALTGAMCVGLLAGCSNGSSGTTSAPFRRLLRFQPGFQHRRCGWCNQDRRHRPPDWLRRHLWHRHQAGG